MCYACFGRTDNTRENVCEPIKIELCRGIGYNETTMPNFIGHELQTEVDLTLQTFSPLIQYGCSTQLNFFLCAAYLPMCTPKINKFIGPCRQLCETVRARCHPVLASFGFSWPSSLDCNRFPKDNNQGSMCMEGPGESAGSSGLLQIPPNKIKSQPSLQSCQYLLKAHLYVRLNKSNRCQPLCEADILFDASDKHLAETWIQSWSISALFLSILATLCLILSNARWDKKLMPLVICHCLVNVSWAIRILAGRNATSCGFDSQFPGISLLLADGLSTSPCSSIFLLRYYFGMSASIWVAILSYSWNQRIRQQIKEAYGSPPNNGKQDSQKNTFFQICAFGLPAIQTVVVLVSRLVDADELIGTCYVGNQSDKALLLLVASPNLLYWMISCGYLLTGYLRKKSLKNVKIPPWHSGLGTFLMIYNVPSAILLLSMFYQFGNRENWTILMDNGSQKAPLWLYIFHPFCEIFTGVLASAWAIGPRIIYLFKGNVKQPIASKPPTPIKYQQNSYNSASYQTICPPNSIAMSSMVSSSMVSFGTVNKMQKRKYSYTQPSLHSSRRMRTSSYRTHSVGNETVL